MEVDVRLLALVFCLCVTPNLAQQCSYMTAIPREPKPEDFPEVDYEGLSWSQRPLVPAPERPDVCMDRYEEVNAVLSSQTIFMDEGIEGDVAIAKFNYDGPNEPYIDQQFGTGTFNLLHPIVNKSEDGDWHLIVTQKQDYESPTTNRYGFRVGVPGEPMIVLVTLDIVNIDDNPPVIHLTDSCQVDETPESSQHETKRWPELTDCEYEVTDEDGEISTRFMRFEIDSERDDDEIFFIQGTNIPNEWKSMYMTLGLNRNLNFVDNALHIFTVTAYDSASNNHSVTMMVQVQNVESRPPRWVEIFAVQQFDEKTEQNFTVRAIDGDTGLNRPIYYRIETAEEDTFFRIETISGGRDGAILFVDPIDRDYLQKQIFQLTIIAYKNETQLFETREQVAIIVDDVNDNPPKPLNDSYYITIKEETAMAIEDLEHFGFHDPDLGAHAQYTIHLETVSPMSPEGEMKASEAFYISPSVGYQLQYFVLGTNVYNYILDFEDPPFQNITIKVVATDMDKPEFVGEAMLYVTLENWNDELPIFNDATLTVEFDETEGEGFEVGTLLAEDRDIGDIVEHSIMGSFDYLEIDKLSGVITVNRNDSFNYHRQNEILVQIRAEDTLGYPFNSATAQLVIKLRDINNTPPTLRLPRGSPSVKENEPVDHLITDEITASDPDTTADLVFEIDWSTSYATKQGRQVDPSEYEGCVDIITNYPDETRRGVATGKIVVREVRPGVTIDYEEFEIIYLTIRVTDRNTVHNEPNDESTFTITIIDLNDNPPVWVEGTLEQEFRVREMSASGVVIGSVLATDIDGPLYNQVRYTLFPRDDTPEGLVKIHFYTGQITVDMSGAIDADVPPRWELYYEVIASDRCYAEDLSQCPPDPTYYDTKGTITIAITDINNKIPEPDHTRFEVKVPIYENATSGDLVTTIVATDLDRDVIYHTVRYLINYEVNPRLLNFFAVDNQTGELLVQYNGPEVLDRDGDEPTHRIFFNLIDNFFLEGDGNRNQDEVDILVVLLDVNDNAPIMPDPSITSFTVSENLPADTSIIPIIHAPDYDEPNTPNSLVGFSIRSLTPINRDIDVPKLFNISSIDTDKGELVSTMDLRGYWGTYSIHIDAFDHGDPQQFSDMAYDLFILPYNYHEPEFVFPKQDYVIRLAREQAVQYNILMTLDGNLAERIHATDEDGLEAGTVTFEVIGNAEAQEYFEVTDDGDNYGTLSLRRSITNDHQDFQVTIRATDGGTDPRPKSSEVSFKIAFVPISGGPVFEKAEDTVAFVELEAGLEENHELPKAEDPRNYLCTEKIDCNSIYYTIFEGNSSGQFGLNQETNNLFLLRELDRSVATQHTLIIVASSSLDAVFPLQGSTLTVTVNVREAQPRPVFEKANYSAGISTLDTIQKVLLTVRATHTENAVLTYTIDYSTMVADPSLESVLESPFILNPETGVLTLNIQPMGFMHGMFEFQVVATDPAGETARADVYIYLISEGNRVSFRFLNTLQFVEENVDFIAETFTSGFGMDCNIDQVLVATDEALGTPLENVTEVRSHFVRDVTPVPAEEIELLRADTLLLRHMQNILDAADLKLSDFTTGVSPDVGTDAAQITIYVLAGLAAVMALLFITTLIAFIIRNRILSRRLEALSITKYDSLDSGLNRVGITAPGTNRHAVEGSNPIWNEQIKAPDFDAISDVSNDSDLIGIEDQPQFRDNYYPTDVSPGDVTFPQAPPAVATHNNNFGFNQATSPFNTEFNELKHSRV